MIHKALWTTSNYAVWSGQFRILITRFLNLLFLNQMKSDLIRQQVWLLIKTEGRDRLQLDNYSIISTISTIVQTNRVSRTLKMVIRRVAKKLKVDTSALSVDVVKHFRVSCAWMRIYTYTTALSPLSVRSLAAKKPSVKSRTFEFTWGSMSTSVHSNVRRAVARAFGQKETWEITRDVTLETSKLKHCQNLQIWDFFALENYHTSSIWSKLQNYHTSSLITILLRNASILTSISIDSYKTTSFRPFQCEYCKTKYYRKNVLKAHLLKCAPKTSSMIASMLKLDQN